MKRLIWLLLITSLWGQTLQYQIHSSVLLNWNTSVGASSYKVYRGPHNGGYLIIATVTATTYTDRTLPVGQSCYVITAVNSSGESGNSNETCTTV